VVAAAALLAACGGSGEPKDAGRAAGSQGGAGVARPRYPYPAARVREFVAACAATPDQRKVCGCTIEWLQSTLPYPEFAAADRAIRAGRPVPQGARTAIRAATEACRE
jgi:hypothetical protein